MESQKQTRSEVEAGKERKEHKQNRVKEGGEEIM